jgi:twitching motility protein PilJ
VATTEVPENLQMKLQLVSLGRLRLWQKFAILAALAFVLVAVPTYQFVNESRKAISFGETERLGIAPSQHLIALVQAIQQYRALAAMMLAGNDTLKPQMDAVQARIDAGIKSVAAEIEDPDVADDGARTAWSQFTQEWTALAGRVGARSISVRDSEGAHRKLVADLFVVMDAVADHTLITLDPDVDTYYLHRIGLYEMAQLSELLAWLRDEGAAYLSAVDASRASGRAGTITSADRVRLASYADRAQERRQSILAASGKIFAATPAIRGRLDGPLRSAADSIQRALQLTRVEVIEREILGAQASGYIAAYNEAIDSLFKVNLASVAELDGGLVARISALRARQFQVLSVIAVLIVLGAVTGYLVIRSVTVPVRQLSEVMQRVQRGDTVARTQLASDDEIGLLGQQFDRMMDEREALSSRVREENEQLNNSVLELLQAVAQLSRRDLTIRAPVAEDVTGAVSDAINLLAAETAKVLVRVTDVAQQVANVSEQVKAQSDSVWAMARVERGEVQEAARELSQTTQTMQEISRLAQECNDAAQRAISTTRTARESVGTTVSSIDTIRDTVRETEKRIKRLGERSQEISSVVNLINTISERTHILALNAAMHAASAGEAGRGFAVVAGEVQRLAENAREATSQIATLVHNIQAETAETVNKMNEVIAQVVDGSRLAEQAGQQMRDTEQSTTQLVSMVGAIANRSHEQARNTEGLKQRADKIEKSTELTGAELQEQAAHTSRLVEYAGKLVEAVNVFTLPTQDSRRAA